MEQVRALVERRTANADIVPNFEYVGDDTGTMLFEAEVEPEERARRAFFNTLTEDAGGNPAVALEKWRHSLFRDRESGAVSVRTYKAPDLARLAAMPFPTLFVLRAILQMDIAGLEQIARATDLPPARVNEILRAIELLGVVAAHDGGYRLSLSWFQEVKRVLLAQNLIVGELP